MAAARMGIAPKAQNASLLHGPIVIFMPCALGLRDAIAKARLRGSRSLHVFLDLLHQFVFA